MRPRAIVWPCVAALCLLMAADLSAGVVSKKATGGGGSTPGELQSGIFLYQGTGTSNYFHGTSVMTVSVSPISGGGKMPMFVPNMDTKATKANPPLEIQELVKKLKVGDPVDVSFRMDGGKPVLDRIAPYEMKAGEDEPNVFIFQSSTSEKVGGKDTTLVKVSKFRQDSTFSVPNVRGADGKFGPKEEMAKVVSDLKQGDLVEILATGGHPAPIRSIKAFEAPKWAEFVKLSKQTVGDQELSVLEVKAYGTSTTLQIARKESANLLAKLTSLKDGSLLIYKSNSDDKGLWLVDVRIPPKGSTMPPEPTKEDAATTKDGDKKAGDKKTDDKKVGEKKADDKKVDDKKTGDKKAGDADKKKADANN